MIKYSLEGREFVELCNLLKVTGLTDSGGEAKMLIAQGLVKVDGVVETRKRCKLREGQKVLYKEAEITINK